MEQLIAASTSLYTNYLLLRSIKGIGIINAIVLLCVTDNFQRFDNPRKFACYCGVAPFEHTSGISIRGKTQTSSLANKEVKVYLTRAAITAISWDPQMKAYYKRKIAEGKHKASVDSAATTYPKNMSSHRSPSQKKVGNNFLRNSFYHLYPKRARCIPQHDSPLAYIQN